MTTPICTHGFRCPYKAMGEEEPICIFPYLPTSPGIEDEEFGLLYDMSMMDCPLNENVEDDELEMLLWAYDTPDIREFIEKRYTDELERYEEAVKRREEQKNEGMSKTPALDRANAVNYGVTDTNACCWHCEHSRTAHYAPSGTKFVCDELNIQTYKNCTCNLFKYKRRGEE